MDLALRTCSSAKEEKEREGRGLFSFSAFAAAQAWTTAARRSSARPWRRRESSKSKAEVGPTKSISNSDFIATYSSSSFYRGL